MISYKQAKLQNTFCECDECLNTYSEEDENGFWEVCASCELPIEDSYVYEGGDYLQRMMLRDD